MVILLWLNAQATQAEGRVKKWGGLAGGEEWPPSNELEVFFFCQFICLKTCLIEISRDCMQWLQPDKEEWSRFHPACFGVRIILFPILKRFCCESFSCFFYYHATQLSLSLTMEQWLKCDALDKRLAENKTYGFLWKRPWESFSMTFLF